MIEAVGANKEHSDMNHRNISRTAAIFAATLITSVASLSETASAQNWDWGGGSVIGGSGRSTVRFSPAHKPGSIVVSFGDRRLYHVTRLGEAHSYPIAIPREQSRWQGVMSITQKRVNPSWTPTPTMRAENPRLPMWVPGGHPMNPLGVRGLYLGSSAYRIHGTDAPWTIGQPVSKGCIRMYNQDVIDLYDRVPVGTKVTVTWQRFEGGAPVASSDDAEKRPAYSRRPAPPRPQYRASRPVLTSAE
jgi:lipoprotein-anchoring transpeptidase ErfK/SrfK